MRTGTANALQYLMRGIDGEAPVLVGTSIKGVVLDALSEVTVTQTYRNDEAKSIEAVYTFPLPLDAILLDLNIRLGEKAYRGEIMPRSKAEESYEKAIKDGDSAIMLENPQPGAYTMNIGNLQPGDECVIAFRYGMFHHWQGDTLRICLPTLIAPRYGDPAAGNFQPHQVPVTDLLAEHTLALNLVVKGTIAGAVLSSPSHEVNIIQEEGNATVDLAKDARLDRDFILEVKMPAGVPIQGYSALDGQQTLVWVPFHPVFSRAEERKPLAVTIVVDCSGSMEGDSIAQAREALLRIVDSLHPKDIFGLITFGSSHTCYSDMLLPADAVHLADLRRHIGEIDADMGGTELGAALRAGYRLRRPEGLSPSVLLITDGQVSDWQKIAADAKNSGQRVFTVGVGSSVTEAAVRQIAEKSGGVCELVSPREDMAGRIYRHFLRMQSPRSQKAAVTWSRPVKKLWPVAMDRLFSGDTLHQCAWFDADPANEARLKILLPEEGTYEQKANIAAPPGELESDTLPRLVAGYRLRDGLSDKEGERIAMAYRLLSPWTHYCAVIVREDGKTSGLPALRQVAQMWPAGGHGIGTVSEALSMPSLMSIADSIGPPPAPFENSAFWQLLKSESAIIDDLVSALPDEVRDRLLQCAGYRLNPEDAVIVFLIRLFDRLDPVFFSKHLARRIREQYDRVRVPYEFDRDRFENSILEAVDLLVMQLRN